MITQCLRCNAYKTLVDSLEKQARYFRKEYNELEQEHREAVKTLQSEREANAILTAMLGDRL